MEEHLIQDILHRDINGNGGKGTNHTNNQELSYNELSTTGNLTLYAQWQ